MLVWQAGSMALSARYPNGRLLLPSPAEVLLRLAELAPTAAFWGTVGRSSLRILGGFALSCALALGLAGAACRFRRVRELLAPLVAAVKAVPVMSFIILALLWIAPAQLALFISGLMVFPPVYLNLLAGLDAMDRSLAEMARVFRVPFGRRVRNLYLPQVLPYFRSACSLALGLCWKAGVAAEVIGLPRGTLGERLYDAKVYWETADLFAWTAVIVAVSVLFEHLFLKVVDTLAGKAGA